MVDLLLKCFYEQKSKKGPSVQNTFAFLFGMKPSFGSYTYISYRMVPKYCSERRLDARTEVKTQRLSRVIARCLTRLSAKILLRASHASKPRKEKKNTIPRKSLVIFETFPCQDELKMIEDQKEKKKKTEKTRQIAEL